MKYFSRADQLKQEIDSYEEHFTGAPLMIGVDDKTEYVALLGMLKDDFGKQIITMSDFCTTEFPPDPSFSISTVSDSAKSKPVVWVGAAQAIMLYGQEKTEKFFINLLGTGFNGPVIILCPFCGGVLGNIGRKYEKLGYNILVAKSVECTIPTINLYHEEADYTTDKMVIGIRALLQVLEEGNYSEEINVVSSCKLDHLAGSMYPVKHGESAYQTLCHRESSISVSTNEDAGTIKQWYKLLVDLNRTGNLTALCAKKLCPIQYLPNDFGAFLSGDDDRRFLVFVCLKVFCGSKNDYLGYCLKKAGTPDDFESQLYDAILDISHNEDYFISWIKQRRRILSSLDENNARIKSFCERAIIKGRDTVWYLSDDTEEEKAALVHALSCYQYSFEDLKQVLSVSSPQLLAYIQKFKFDEYNTKVMESDADVRDLLTDYFHEYKLQKIMNRNDKSFVELVEKEATTRSFTKLQARSAIIKKLSKENVQTYFFDALGVEFLSFIQSKAEAYGMQFECYIGHCNLPSITSKNKEFYDVFPENSILKEDRLDELKHHGTKYDYQLTTEPLYIFDELAILDGDLKKMSSALALGKCKRIIIVSDHGASRLAVTYQSENKKLELTEPGKHSGRCCPVDADPQIEFASYEDGFAVLANYERFKGSRKADVETHGGASLEETVVPVIQLTLKPKEQQIFFVESVITCSPKDGSSIRLFANPPIDKPIMLVGETKYEGKFDGDKHNVVFQMPDIRRKGHYEAQIYNEGTKIAELTFETRRQTGSNDLI